MGDFEGIKQGGFSTFAKRMIFPIICLTLLVAFALALVLPFMKMVFQNGSELTIEGWFFLTGTKTVNGETVNIDLLETLIGKTSDVYLYSSFAVMCLLAATALIEFIMCFAFAGKFNRKVFAIAIILSAVSTALTLLLNLHFYSLADLAAKNVVGLNGASRSLMMIPLAISAATLCFSVLARVFLKDAEDYERSFLGELFGKNKKKK